MSYQCYIVTFYHAINYGAVLQTYALKRICEKNIQTFVYPYENKKIKYDYSLNPFQSSSFTTIIAKFLKLPTNFIRKLRFTNFIHRYLINDRPNTNKVFYITGSDQVWNYILSDFDKTYFLDFVPDDRLKNSYAASFGFESIPEKLKDEYRQLLTGYNMMSVREEAGQKILKDLIDRDVPVTLDPTLLLSGEQWSAAFCTNNIQEQYILVYAFMLTDSMSRLINKLSEEKNLPVIILMPDRSIRKHCPIKRAKFKTTVSPEMWVNYFYHATYIVTNSFHGTVFSINFNKTFFVELLPPPAKVNSRLTHILDMFHLSDRIFDGDLSIINRKISYEKVNQILCEKRKESLKYLESIALSYHE